MGGEVEDIEEARKFLVISSAILLIVSAVVLAFSQERNPELVFSLKKSMIGQRVAVVGKVVWQRESNNVCFGEIDTGISRIRFFNPSCRDFNGTGTGIVKEYKGRLELVLE